MPPTKAVAGPGLILYAVTNVAALGAGCVGVISIDQMTSAMMAAAVLPLFLAAYAVWMS